MDKDTDKLARDIIDGWVIEGRVPKYHQQKKRFYSARLNGYAVYKNMLSARRLRGLL